MKLEKGNVKRCGLFLYFDKQGIVDDYISYMLNDLKKSVDYLLVVCNGYIERKSLKKLQDCSDEVLCRANVGFDLGGYREGLFYLGWKQLEQYDEIVMMNYTFFGPLYPFSEMFDAMAEKDVDFWGVTKHHKVEPDPFGQIPYGYLPEHLQSHLIVVRRSLFMSYQYRDFMMNRKNPANYTEAICTYEAIFTKVFSDLGFTWDVYMDTSDLEGVFYYPVMFAARDAIENRRCPVIKRRSFFTSYDDFLLNTCGEATTEAYDYLMEHDLYDLNLIWDNILRLENLTAIHRSLHLNYMLESYHTDFAWDKKVAVVLIADDAKHPFFYRRYLASMPEWTDIHLYGKKENCTEISKMWEEKGKVQIHPLETESYTETLLAAAKDLKDCSYDYVGVARLRDFNQKQPYSNEISWQKGDWDNLYGNRNICGNLLQFLEKNPRMGMCIPPIPRHGSLFAKTQSNWCGRFRDVKEYLDGKSITVNVNQEENPLMPFGGSFWIRGTLMSELSDYMEGLDEELALMVLPLVLQHLKFYTGIAYSDRYTSVPITNQDYMLRENNRQLFRKYGPSYHVIVRHRILTDDMTAGEEWLEKDSSQE